jgi:hypothetical protein
MQTTNFKRASAAAIMLTLGVFAGCAASDDTKSEPTEERAEALCCIDYACPNTDIEYTGCKPGPGGPGSAYQACNEQCAVPCTSSGLYCDP